MQTVIKTIVAECGEIYGISNGSRISLGECSPTLELIADEQPIGISGLHKTYRFTIVFCNKVNTRHIERYSNFELSVTILRQDGKYEVIHIYDPVLIEIDDLFDRWTFEITDKELIRKVYRM